MSRGLKSVLSAAVVGLASVSSPAIAAVTYSFMGGVAAGSTSLSFEFVVTTPQFITSASELSPATASCVVTSPVLESCSISTDILFAPRAGFGPDSVAFSALLKPFFSDFAYSQAFGASFAFPPGVHVFETPGLYTATSFLNLLVARLEVSGFAEPPPVPIPEPSTWLLLIGGLGLTGAAARSRASRGRARPVGFTSHC